MKKIIFLLILLATTHWAVGQQIFSEDFNLAQNFSSWRTANAAFGGGVPNLTSGGLSYSGFPTATGGTDGSLALTSNSGGLAHAAIYSFGSNVYTAFLIQVQSSPTNDNLIMNLIGSAAAPLNDYGFVMKDNGSSSLKFGLKVNGTSTYATGNYVYNTTYLIVVKYTDATKKYSLFVNPTLVSEPAALVTSLAHNGSAPLYISQVQFNQYSGVTATIDGVRVVSQWSDLIINNSPSTLISESFSTSGSLSAAGWNEILCCNSLDSDSPGLNYSTLGTGNAAYHDLGSGAFTKQFPTVFSGMIYASFLFDEGSNAANTFNSNVNFYDPGQPSDWNFQQGFVMDNSNLSLKYGQLSTDVTNGPTSFSTSFVVLGYNINTGQYSLWVNPPLGTTTPPTANITAFSSTITSVSGLSIINMGDDDPVYDEIRVSTNWSDVVATTFPEPAPATNLVTTPNSGSVNGVFTSGFTPGLSYLVVASSDTPANFAPVDGSPYFTGNHGTYEILSNTSNTNFNDFVSGSTKVSFYQVYSFTDDGSKNYNPNSPAQDIAAQDPGVSISINSTAATESSISFSAPSVSSSADGFVVLRAPSPFGPTFPGDGQLLTTGMTNGTTTVAYAGNSTSFTDTGLIGGTQYNYITALYTGTGTYINYSGSVTNVSVSTLKTEPPTQPINLTFPFNSQNGITLDWNSGGVLEDGYLVIYKAGSSPTNGAPVDGTMYNSGQSLGGGTVGFRGSLTDLNINSLTSNTEYFFDIYSYSLSSDENFYNYHQLAPLEGSTFTLATQPSGAGAITFNVTTSTSFNISFSGSATNYLVLRRALSAPDVDPSDGNSYVLGSALGSATVIYNGSTTSFVDNGLTPGTNYYYKIFAYNGTGTASNYAITSPLSSRFTAPADPVANTASSIAQTSFTASWNTPATTTSYRLDVSTSNAFSTFVGSYNDLSIGTSTTSVTGLAAGVTYYYRVRAVSSTGTSGSSNIVTLVTAPPDPVAIAATSPTQSSFTANWNTSATATSYFLDVSTGNTFSSFVHQNVAVGNVLTFNVTTSLTAGIVYYYRVRASNGATSGSSNVVTVTTTPPNPVSIAATTVTATSFNANWNTSLTATGYQLDVSTINTFSSFVTGYNSLAVSGGSTISQAVTTLSAGTTYYYRVRATSANGTSGNSATSSVLTLPAAPVAAAATAVSTNSFNAVWASVLSATSYRLDVSTTNTFTAGTFVAGYQDVDAGNVGTTAVNGLINGTTYYYRVRVVNPTGVSASSNTITTITAPPAPVALAATTFTQTSFSANWSAAASATGYRLDVSVDPAFGSFVGVYNNLSTGNVTTLSVTSLAAGTNYYYRVRATSSSGTSINSSSIVALTIPPNPVVASATSIGQTTFNANWSASATATGYRLDVATNSAFTGGTFVSGYQDLAVSNVTTFAVNSNLAAGTTYFYRIRSVNTSGTSSSSANGTVTTAPPNPVASAASAFGQTNFTANWNSAATATGYFVDVATDGSFASLVSGYNSLSVGNVLTLVVNSNLTSGTNYFYRVRAFSANGTSGNSNSVSLITVPGNPVATAASPFAPLSFTANWNAVTGATSYRLDVSTSNTFGTFVSGYADLNIGNVVNYNVNTNLNAGSTYFYRVRAVNGSGTSSNSNTISALTPAPAPVATSATGATQTTFTAHWNTSTSATSYVIDVSPDGFSTFVPAYQDANVGNVTSVAVNGLSGGITYSYRIRAVNASGKSPNSNTIAQVTIPDAPTITTATAITTTSFVANWAATAGADSYRLDVSTDNFSTFLVGFNNLTVPGTNSNVTGLTEGVTYSYRVRAVNTSGTSGNSAVASVITVPPAPTATNATDVTTTSFTANWGAVDGATQYFLDISTDDFNTFLPGYNNKSTVAISEALSGLTPNTTYKYRLRATSSSGTSTNSNVAVVTSYSTSPVATGATVVNQTAFNANWNAVAGISSYELDVSTDNFATMVPTYNAFVVTQTSQTVSGLTPGAAYIYRVRAVNAAGPSANSNAISVSTVPATPIANSATNVAQKGFTATWTSADNATDYLLDLSTVSDFTTFQAGYNAKAITSTTETISELLAGTTYYYRVRSRNASGESPSSNKVSQITIPGNPSATVVTAKSNTSFIAVWDPVTGADSYELDVTTFSANFTSFITNYESHAISGGDNTEEEVIGLTPGTAYRYRVRAVNAGGKSGNSNARSVQTDGGNVGEFTVAATPASTQFSGTEIKVAVDVTNSTGIVTAVLTYRGLADSTIHTKPVLLDEGVYSVKIEDGMLDELGIQFTVTAEDELGKTKTTETQKIYRSFTSTASPVFLNGSFSGDRSSIRIVSIPYDLKDNLIESIFVSLGAYDKKSWRLAHYQDGANVEYGDKLNKIERGLGYWFNAKGNVSTIKTGEAVAPKNDKSTPYTLSLAQGWNQIGNPFPFAIDWSDVLADNKPASGVSDLKIYSTDKQNFDNGNKIDVFSGGFVHADNAVSLTLKVSLKGRANGSRVERPAPDLANDSWQLPLSLKQGNSEYDLSAVGMNPGASDNKDEFDEIRPPRLDDFLDVTFDHPGSKFRYFTKDIVPTSNQASWEFYIQSSGKDESATIEWDNSQFGSNVAKIYLLDIGGLQMIDMRTSDHYSFVNPGRKEFRIYYRKDGGEISPDLLGVSTPYPNPSSGVVTMSIALPAGNGDFNTELVAFDMLGRQIHSSQQTLPAGIHHVSWDGHDASGNRIKGLCLLRARVNNNWLGQSYRVVIE